MKLKEIISKIKTSIPNIFKEFLSLFVCKTITDNKRKKLFFNVIFYLTIFATFITVIFQAPFFIDAGLNNIALVIWPGILFLLVIFDYKKFISAFFKAAIVISPFLIYLVVAFAFGVNAFSSELTKLIFISLVLFIFGSTFSSYLSKENLIGIMFSYIIGAFILGALIYFSVLRGSDISSSVYAYGDKNSSAPILFIATIFSFYIYKGRNIPLRVARIIFVLFLVALIAIMKCRTVLITMPFVYAAIFFHSKPTKTLYIIAVASIVFALIFIFAIPSIRTIVITHIFFNNQEGRGVDALFSGRFTIIFEALENLKPVLGNGDKYIDCLPIQILCSFGFVGFISLLPICFYHFYILYKYRDNNGPNDFYFVLLLLTVTFFLNAIVEGHGQFGPGAKTFIFWIFLGILNKNYAFDPIDKSSTILANKTKPNTFGFALAGISNLLLILMFCIPSLFNNVSSTIYDRFDVNPKTAEYIPIESINIEGPDVICIGQKIAYSTNTNPINPTDKSIFFESWSNSVMFIETDTNLVVGRSEGQTTLKAYCYDYQIDGRKHVSVVSQDNFDFSIYDFSIAFLNGNTSSTFLLNQKDKICYDTNLFPCKNLITFTSSNPNIVEIDSDGFVTAKEIGQCTITASIENSICSIVSNTLTINVGSQVATPITRYDLGLPNTISQNVTYDFKPVFYSDDFIIDCKYDISITGSRYFFQDGKIGFKDVNPNVEIILIPHFSSADISCKKTISVEVNTPISLVVKVPDWMQVGEVYRFEPIINYQNGFSREALPKEIKATSLRAGPGVSGHCNDYCHYAAITSGNGSITYEIVGTAITKKKSFHIYKENIEEHAKNATNNSSAIFLAICVLISLSSIFLDLTKLQRSKKSIIIFTSLFLLANLLPFFISLIINHFAFSFIHAIILILGIAAFAVLIFVKNKTKYKGLQETEVLFDKRTQITVNYYSIEI